MEWIKVNHKQELPHDGSVFLSMWKGRICMTQYDIDEGRFYIIFNPAEYSQCMCVSQSRENKFEYWMPLPNEKHSCDV
jgi:hypothetical protein